MELDPARLQTMLAEGEAHLDALRSDVASAGDDGDLPGRIARLEDRFDQQEAVLRHALTMLIEWLEAESVKEADEA